MTNILNILKEQKDSKLKGNLYHITQILFAYNTNHIEGSTLTEEQTRYIYETNTLITDTSNLTTNIDDIIETSNHFKLVDYMLDNANNVLTEDLIKKFHKILKTGTSYERLSWFNIGEYKKLTNEVNGNVTSKPEDVEKDMKALLKWYNSIENVKLEDIIKFHSQFEKIHPFQDGNGRVGRIIMFKECLRNNIVPFIILDKDKLFYYRGLNEYQNNREKGYLIDTCLNAQDQYKLLITKYLNVQFEE
ncbi:MAG: Fic family protein [Clostridia bacterium]|nr:Fic family protein [Clostridia bacterium]